MFPEVPLIAGLENGDEELLLGMPQAQHLFHSVYAMSGALADVTAERSEVFGRTLAAAAGVEPTLEGFSSVPEGRLLDLQKDATAMTADAMEKVIEEGLALGPAIDGDLIARPTRESLRAGVGADMPLVMGTTDDEFSMAMADAAKALRWVPRGLLLGKFGFAEHCLDVPFFFDCLDGPVMEPLAGPTPQPSPPPSRPRSRAAPTSGRPRPSRTSPSSSAPAST